jgi:hypothetical protein
LFSIFLPLVRSHVAAAVVFPVRPRFAPLVGRENMTVAVGAALRVARIDRRASRKQRHGLGRATIVLQASQQGLGVVQIASVVYSSATWFRNVLTPPTPW